MKIVIIGAVAAGTSAATEARRHLKEAEIKIFETDNEISYIGAGMPYYIGGMVAKRSTLVPRDAVFFKQKHNIDIYTRHSVKAINPEQKNILVENLATGETFVEPYDKLVLATGAVPFVPPMAGIEKENVFALRSAVDADRIKDYMQSRKPKTAVIVGTGFIGLEMAEILAENGISITLVELAPQIMPALDSDMSDYIEAHLREQKVEVIKGDSVVSVISENMIDEVVLKSGRKCQADMVIWLLVSGQTWH